LKLVPTAMQDDPDVQDTAKSTAAGTPAGLGVGWMLHRVPFHRSAKVTSTPELVT
jgi:hypothetical protein